MPRTEMAWDRSFDEIMTHLKTVGSCTPSHLTTAISAILCIGIPMQGGLAEGNGSGLSPLVPCTPIRPTGIERITTFSREWRTSTGNCTVGSKCMGIVLSCSRLQVRKLQSDGSKWQHAP